MRRYARAICWTLAIAVVSLACRGPAQWRYEERLAGTPGPTAHGVHEERLAVLMRDLGRLRDQRLPKAFDVREEEGQRAREIARVLQAMAESAPEISAAEPGRLGAAESEEFRALAEAMRHSAARLAEDAPHLSVNELRIRMAEIDATCNHCHGRFRIPGVTLEED